MYGARLLAHRQWVLREKDARGEGSYSVPTAKDIEVAAKYARDARVSGEWQRTLDEYLNSDHDDWSL